jgi:hypothetical protein
VKLSIRNAPAKRSRRPRAKPQTSRSWIGRDLAREYAGGRRSRRLWAAVVIGAVLAGLAIVRVRVTGIDQSYALATAMKREKALLEELRVLTAHRRQLRDPRRLQELAPSLELVRTDRVIALAPAPDSTGATRP